jgi:hypothetical protein
VTRPFFERRKDVEVARTTVGTFILGRHERSFRGSSAMQFSPC